MKISGVILILLLIASCSNRAAYNDLQHNQRSACAKLPEPQVEECLATINKSYEEYRRDREDAMKEID